MPLAEFISASLFQEQIAANLMSLLAGIAFVLAAMGFVRRNGIWRGAANP